MYRYFIFFSYNGSNYHGWQIQPNGITVQEVLTKALITFLRKEVKLVGAGRTDSGVHARDMAAHFDIDDKIDVVEVANRLNRILPFDIAVDRLVEVQSEAHARFDALDRTYQYYVSQVKDPFLNNFSWYIYQPLDFELMNQAATTLLSVTDFTSFSKLHSNTKTNFCTVTRADWKVGEGGKLIFTIKANRFLRDMVRAIVGTLVDVGRGKISIEEFNSIIQAKDRAMAGASAPGQALFLTKVSYPKSLFINKI